jgi:NAD(P)-dependent dehydrogenase (short-subunit alcohol dehydrogenase family)
MVAIIGIGANPDSFGIVARLLQQDAIVVVPAQSSNHLQRLHQYLSGLDTSKLVTLLTDFPDYDKVVALAEMVQEEYGPLDIVVFRFDYPSISGSFSNITLAQWERAVQENLAVYFICSRVAMSAMKKRGEGMFVALIDTDGLAQQPDNALTEMLMAAQKQMARSFFEEVKNTDVKFYQLFINNLDTHTYRHEAGSKAITPEMIGKYILSIYNGNVQSKSGPFLFLMGKPDPDIHHYFTKL